MSNIIKFHGESKDIGEFSKKYFDYLRTAFNSIDPKAINQLEEELLDARENGNTIFIAGNGGSAATATTMANDLGFDIIKKANPDKHFRVFALTDNTSIMTAIANDVGYENLFVCQLQVHYKPGDKLIVISASGNSPNVVRAVQWVKERGGRTIGFLGFSGGRLKELCDVIIHAKTVSGEYGPVEDIHLILNHILAHWFQISLNSSGKEI